MLRWSGREAVGAARRSAASKPKRLESFAESKARVTCWATKSNELEEVCLFKKHTLFARQGL